MFAAGVVPALQAASNLYERWWAKDSDRGGKKVSNSGGGAGDVSGGMKGALTGIWGVVADILWTSCGSKRRRGLWGGRSVLLSNRINAARLSGRVVVVYPSKSHRTVLLASGADRKRTLKKEPVGLGVVRTNHASPNKLASALRGHSQIRDSCFSYIKKSCASTTHVSMKKSVVRFWKAGSDTTLKCQNRTQTSSGSIWTWF